MHIITTAFFVDGTEFKAGTPLSKAPRRVHESVIRSGWTMEVDPAALQAPDETPPAHTPPADPVDDDDAAEAAEAAADDESGDGDALLDVSELSTRQQNVLKREGIVTLAEAREANAQEGGLAAIDGITEAVAARLAEQL